MACKTSCKCATDNLIGRTIDNISQVYTEWSERHGDAATFFWNVIGFDSNVSLQIDVEHKRRDEIDSSSATIASFSAIGSTGVKSVRATGLKELVRCKLTWPIPEPVDDEPPIIVQPGWVHLDMLSPCWETNEASEAEVFVHPSADALGFGFRGEMTSSCGCGGACGCGDTGGSEGGGSWDGEKEGGSATTNEEHTAWAGGEWAATGHRKEVTDDSGAKQVDNGEAATPHENYMWQSRMDVVSPVTLLDDPGCDNPMFDTPDLSICCALHDKCYHKNGCTVASWYTFESVECAMCNAAAIWCFFGDTPKSPCHYPQHYCYTRECGGQFFCAIGCKTEQGGSPASGHGNSPPEGVVCESGKYDWNVCRCAPKHISPPRPPPDNLPMPPIAPPWAHKYPFWYWWFK